MTEKQPTETTLIEANAQVLADYAAAVAARTETVDLTTRTTDELVAMFEAATRTSYNASDVEAIVAELDRRRPKCETRTGTDRCTEDATYVVVRAAIPATPYFPEQSAVRSAQCSRHAAMWTRTDRNGRPVHPTMTVEPLL